MPKKKVESLTNTESPVAEPGTPASVPGEVTDHTAEDEETAVKEALAVLTPEPETKPAEPKAKKEKAKKADPIEEKIEQQQQVNHQEDVMHMLEHTIKTAADHSGHALKGGCRSIAHEFNTLGAVAQQIKTKLQAKANQYWEKK